MENKKLPLKVIRVGNVKVVLWENMISKDGKEIPVVSVNVSKSYKLGEEWKETQSFNINDLPKINIGVKEAYKFLLLKEVD